MNFIRVITSSSVENAGCSPQEWASGQVTPSAEPTQERSCPFVRGGLVNYSVIILMETIVKKCLVDTCQSQDISFEDKIRNI